MCISIACTLFRAYLRKKYMVKKTQSETKEQEVQSVPEKIAYYEAVGRRKEATARVRLYVAKEEMTIKGVTVKRGNAIINGIPGEKYFPGEVMKKELMEPFRTTNTLNRFCVTVLTTGGGLVGQLGAVILGISRALEKVDKEKFRPILKKRGFMKRDPRIKQRRKAGFAGKSRAKKQSPKR